jgi:hypothetical protein
MNNTLTKRYIAAAVLLLLGIFVGCNTGDYEQRLNKRINDLKTGSKFNILSSSVEVPGTQVSLRVPEDFKNPPFQEGAKIDGKAVDPRRIKPNLLDLGDLKLTYEGFVQDKNNGKQYYYLYVAVSTGQNRKFYPRVMQADLTTKIPDTSQVADVSPPPQTPEGRNVDWSECHGTGNQPFYYTMPNGEGKFIQLPGSIYMFFHDENDVLVTLIWRLPTSIEQNVDFKSWTELVAGCVKVRPKAGAAGAGEQ